MPLDPTTGMETIPQDPSSPAKGVTSSSVQDRLDALTKDLDALQAAANAPPGADGLPTPEAFMAQQQLPKLLTEWRQMQALADKEKANPKAPAVKIFTAADGSTYSLDTQGNKVQLSGPKVIDKPFTIPGDTPGTTKPATWEEYNAYMTAKNKADANQNTQDRTANDQTNAIARLTQANDLAQQRTDLGYYQANLQNQVDQGKLSEQQAMDLFKQKYDMMTFEQTQQQNAQAQRQAAFNNENTMLQSGIAAGTQAMDAAQRGVTNAVGPQFGAHYAASLSAASKGDVNGVHFGAGDFTTPMPNYQQMATQGAAAAIAHLSPYAASLVGQPGMQQYQGAGSAPIQPAVAASQYVPPNNEATASQTQRMMTMPIPPYQPVNRAVGANAQIQAGLR